jgi:very-short-patch-repair endonuclease
LTVEPKTPPLPVIEIDGKQHKYADRHERDIVRDEFVKSRGVEVFRIDWNSINTEDGKKLMKEKIEEFLNFIGK